MTNSTLDSWKLYYPKRSLVIGHWLWVIGHWSLVIGHWSWGEGMVEAGLVLVLVKQGSRDYAE